MMQQSMNDRPKEHGSDRQKDDSRKQSVRRRKPLPGNCVWLVPGPHAGENQRGIHHRIEPRQILSEVITKNADPQPSENNPAGNGSRSRQPQEKAAQWNDRLRLLLISHGSFAPAGPLYSS